MTDPLAWLVAREGVTSAYAASRDAVDVLLRDRGLRRTGPDTTTESLLRGAWASAALAGADADLTQVRDGTTDPVAAAAVRLSTELLGLVPVLTRSPLQALARLHAVAAAGELPEEEKGRPRDRQGAARLRGVAELLTADTAAPAMLVAAVAHADIVTAEPFATHNGLVARAVERLVLVSRGVDPASVTVPEAGHLELRAAYESNLRGYGEGGAAGVHSWALYAAEAFARGAERSPLAD